MFREGKYRAGELTIRVPWRGFEPPRSSQLILNQPCLPFHHQGQTFIL